MRTGVRCWVWLSVALSCFCNGGVQAQVNVTTFQNDNSRTGQNTQETILTPGNVNSTLFGKLFSLSVDGYVYAQPLYLSGVTIGAVPHNVLYVATEHDSLYGIDADTGAVLKQVSLLPPGGTPVNSISVLGCTDLVPEVGITGTPVIDTSTGTLYLVAKSQVGGGVVQYLHAIDISTFSEKFGGPVLITATATGTASDAVNNTITFNAGLENQRPALLLDNGHVVISWAAHCDGPPWHGWVISYSASTLAREAVRNLSPNGTANGVWMSGGGLAADASGNIFFATGNGSWNGTTDFGDSIIRLGLPSGGSFPVQDYFTPYNQANLSSVDTDLGSGGLVLLPPLASGKQLLVQMGKEGKMYVLDRNNMGQYCVNASPACSGSDPQIVQEIAFATPGIWGVPAYWNGNVYWSGVNDTVKAFAFNAGNSGLISTSPTSKSAQIFAFPGVTPAISANGTTAGIFWALYSGAFDTACSIGSTCQALYAYDATNLGTLLYSSNQAAGNRDALGAGVKFATPTVANGKVYVGSQSTISAFGLLGSQATAANPAVSPAAGTYPSTQSVTLSDTTPGASIYYTTDGTTPSAASMKYSAPLSISATTTLNALAIASGYTNSGVTSATFTIATPPPPIAANPAVSPAAGTYPSTQSVTLSDTTPGASIYYTTDGTTPSAASMKYSAPLSISATTTLNALAIASGYTNSGVTSATFTISAPPPPIAANPAVSPAAGTYPSTQSVTLSDTTPGASIYYTTDGTTPSAASMKYSAPLSISATTTLNALAIASGYTNSGVTSATFTISAPPPPIAASPTVSPAAGTYPSTQSVTLSDTTPGASIYYTTDGTTPSAASMKYSAPLSISATTTLNALAIASGYTNSGVTSATFTISAPPPPIAASPTVSPAAGTYPSTQSVTLSDTTPGASIYYTTDGTTPSAASMKYSAPLSISATTTLNALAIASGYTNSGVTSATFTISAPTPTPAPTAAAAAASPTVKLGGGAALDPWMILALSGLVLTQMHRSRAMKQGKFATTMISRQAKLDAGDGSISRL